MPAVEDSRSDLETHASICTEDRGAGIDFFWQENVLPASIVLN
jgi:hypothetical protein